MKNQLMKLIILVFFSFLIACTNNGSDNNQLEDITSRIDSKSGFKNIFLRITEITKTDGGHVLVAKGLYKGKTVGLKIAVSANIDAGIIDGKRNLESGYRAHAVFLESIGQESDELVKALSELYDQPTDKGFTTRILSGVVFSLNEVAVDLDKNDYYKLEMNFIEQDDSGGVIGPDFFLNINTTKQEIEIHEEDKDYRKDMIKLFTMNPKKAD